MTRAIAYIDGFNLYHAIDDLNKLKWLDLWALNASLAREGEFLAKVYYFSAYPTWKPESEKRHRMYVRALMAQGVTCHLGHFKRKDKRRRPTCYRELDPAGYLETHGLGLILGASRCAAA